MIPIVVFLLLSALCHCSSVWSLSQNGFWTTDINWTPPEVPSETSSVQFTTLSSPITVTIDSPVIIGNLTLVDDVTLLFTNNASLTVLNSFTMFGGTLQSHSSSFLSNTSTPYLVLDGFDFFLFSHLLVITTNITWRNGVLFADSTSELLLRDCDSQIKHTANFQGSNIIYGWGLNVNGQLGLSHNNNQFNPSSVLFPSKVRQASLGRFHSLVLLANGDVYTSGSNHHGQLGHNDGDANFFRKIEISRIIQVNTGTHSSFALTSNGLVLVWGRNNDDHQLGLNSTGDIFEPILNPTLSHVIQLAGKLNSFFCFKFRWQSLLLGIQLGI
ncbi:hypothetical protein GEMRC1_009328 [Eukaryota sp. GEM-RC1]